MKLLILLLILLGSCSTQSNTGSGTDVNSGASADATTSASVVDLKSFQYYKPQGFKTSAKKVLFVVSDPRKDSVTYDLAKTAMRYFEQDRKFDVELRDLYDLNWSPVLWLSEFFYQKDGKGVVPTDVKREQELVKKADYIVFVYPNWHDSPNAILKGYIERVFAAGFAYKNSSTGPSGLLYGRKIFTIMNAGGIGGGRGYIGDGSEKWDKYMNAFKVLDDDLAEWWGMSPVGTDEGNLGRFVNDKTPKNVFNYNNSVDKERYANEISALRTSLTNHLNKKFR